MDVQQTYSNILNTRSGLGYEAGLVEHDAINFDSPVKKNLYTEAVQRIGRNNFDAISFAGNVPIAYFKLLSDFDCEVVRTLHKLVWNQNRVPSLYIITPSELRIYNCFEEPIKPNDDVENLLVHRIDVTRDKLNKYHEFSKIQFDSGEFWKSKFGRSYRSENRVDYHLLSQLSATRKILHDNNGLPYNVIHNLLGRSIFILYLEDRKAIRNGYYSQFFMQNAESFLQVLKSKEATYSLFDTLAKRFNGDLMPITDQERNLIKQQHLDIVQNLFGGGDVKIGQLALWRPYDFGVIPIELVSAIYEEFLHTEQDKEEISKRGTYYTPHSLVEFVMNEVLPWPSHEDHSYNVRILDPACGSGIFLVEGYRRLISRWMYSSNTDNISPSQLRNLLVDNIYGVDINPDAVNVAAFSLYLSLLDHLKPRTIWERLKFPYLTSKNGNNECGGHNLYARSTFEQDAPFENKNFDLIVGNPPWKRGGLPEDIALYCSQNKIAQESAQAFAWRAKDFSSGGRIALIVNSKTFFNKSKGDRNFRKKLLSECEVETVINFSALRKKKGEIGKQLFATAVGPASVIIYKNLQSDRDDTDILYCTPKPTRFDNALPSIVIDASEIQIIPTKQFRSIDNIWKIAMWGTQRDAELIEKFKDIPLLQDEIDKRENWHAGVGLEGPGEGGMYNDKIAKLPLIKTSLINRYFVGPNSYERIKMKDKTYRRVGAILTYKSPHILIKEGQKDKRFCAAYADFDCAFRKAVFGISSLRQNIELLKGLVAFLNSSFASYYLFLTTATWGVERERVNFKEMLSLPSIPFQMGPKTIKALAEKVDKIIELMAFESIDIEAISSLEAETDEIIYNFMGLSHEERILINDVLSFSLDFFQNGENSVAAGPTANETIFEYAELFCKVINSVLKFGKKTAWASVYLGRSPLKVVTINFSDAKFKETVIKSNKRINEALEEIDEKLLKQYSDNVYVRRHLKVYNKDSIDIIKPDENRFWTKSAALKDADAMLSEGINYDLG